MRMPSSRSRPCTAALETGLVFALFAVAVWASAATVEAGYEEAKSCGQLFYRTMFLDEANKALYVGGMDRLIRFDAANVSVTDCERDSMYMEANNVANCVAKGKNREYDCRNHIRVIQPIGQDNSRLYVCGTNGHSPKDQVCMDPVFCGLGSSGRNRSAFCQVFKPFDPFPSTWLFISR